MKPIMLMRRSALAGGSLLTANQRAVSANSDIRAGGAWQGSIAQDPLDCFLDLARADDLATSFVVEAPPGSGIEFIVEADRDNGVIRLRAYQPSARRVYHPPPFRNDTNARPPRLACEPAGACDPGVTSIRGAPVRAGLLLLNDLRGERRAVSLSRA
jgi:hypothetical protein